MIEFFAGVNIILMFINVWLLMKNSGGATVKLLGKVKDLERSLETDLSEYKLSIDKQLEEKIGFIEKARSEYHRRYEGEIDAFDIKDSLQRQALSVAENKVNNMFNGEETEAARKSMERAADQWFTNFTEKNFEELMKDRLKQGSQRLLADSFERETNKSY